MSDYVTKLIPYEPFEIDYIEAWLDGWAAKGLILQDITWFFAHFKKALPCEIHFRMDYRPGMDLEKESARRSLVKENGWEYVTIFSGRYTIYMSEDPSLTELPPDETTAKATVCWKDLTYLLPSILIPFLLAFLFYENYLNGQISVFYSMVHGGFQALIRNLAIIIAFFILAFPQINAFRRRKEREKDGVLRSSEKPTTHRERLHVTLKFIPAIMILFALVVGFWGFQHGKENPLQDYGGSVPFPLLEEINPGEGRALSEEAKTNTPNSDVWLENYITKEHHFLAQEIITVSQTGPSTKVNETTEWSTYAYTVQYHQMQSIPLAERLTKELSELSAMQAITPASQGVKALYSGNMYGQSLILQYQNIVIEVWYRGASNLRECIPLYEAHLGIKQDT